MKKLTLLFMITAVIVFSAQFYGTASNGHDLFNKIKIDDSDIPEGFIYGKIPTFAKEILKDNPWELDGNAIRNLADQIYPGGDYSKISGIYMSILAKKETPHGDDIVCYLILFNDESAAKGEIKKIKEFAGYNGDRVIVEVQNSLAVFFHVDDVKDFPLIVNMNEKIKKKLKSI